MVDTLDQLAQEITQCQRCELRMNATQPVCGHGEVGARYMIIGESPGREEDEAGVPFIGKAGRKLDKLLELADIDINDCFITNTIRCRPLQNRDPKKNELSACREFLEREIAVVKPKTIISVGRYALGFFGLEGITQLHGTQHQVEVNGQEYTLVTQYHPAASFKRPRLWADILEDWEHLPEKVPSDFRVVDWRAMEEWLDE